MSLPDGSGSLTANPGDSVQLSLGLGQTINANVDANAPLNPAVPYLYFVAQAGESISAKFGNDSLSVGTTRSLSIIVDPADPSLYVGVDSPPIKQVSSLGIGLSWNGLIPFKPVAAPSQFKGTFYGNIYAQASVKVPIPYTLGIASVKVGGALDLSIDALLDHVLRDALMENALVGTLSAAVAAGNLGLLFANNPPLIDELAYGDNGTWALSLGIPGVDASASFQLAQASGVDTGTANPSLYFRGQATDNLFQGTRLESYMSYVRPTTTFTLDGSAQPVAGTFNSTFTTNYSYFTFNATSTTFVSGTGLFTSALTLTGTTSGSLSFLGATPVTYKGVVFASGGFQLNGKGNVTIAGFTLAIAEVVVRPNGITIAGDLNLGPIGTANLSCEATRDGNFTLTGTHSTNFGTHAPNTIARLDSIERGLVGGGGR